MTDHNSPVNICLAWATASVEWEFSFGTLPLSPAHPIWTLKWILGQCSCALVPSQIK